jgi:DNA invertase Pin-like site-specific DNA recombinase
MSDYVNTPVRALAYLRVSGPSQLAGDGFPRQREAIENYAVHNNLKIVSWHEERAVPGKTEWEDRPAWVEMVTKLTPQTKTIVIERLDRLARDLGVQEWIIRELERRRIGIVSTNEPDLDSKDPTRTLFRQIMGSVYQFEKSMLVCKLRAARERIRRRGEKCEGRYCFGYDPERPGEAAVLELMLKWHADGATYNEIQQKLNLNCVSTRDSKTWYGATVSRLIRRELAKRA